jgi:cardiolipin synthase
VLLAVLGTSVLLGACRVLPQVQLARTVPLSRSPTPVDIESPNGPVGRASALRTTRQLAATGDTDMLDYHLAAMRDLGAPPLLTDNSAELLIDGPRTYRAMFAAIEAARQYIFLESFIFEEAVEGDRRLSELLRQAAGRGIHIYVLYDAVGSLTTEAQFLEGLKAGGIALCAFNPLNPLDDRFAGLNQRDHRKIFVVDGEQAFAGGVNFSHAYRIASKQARSSGLSKQKSLDQGWRDTHIGMRGPAALKLEQLFRELWREAGCAGELQPAFEERAVDVQRGEVVG